MNAPLHRLPNGDWIDSALVTAIISQPAANAWPDRLVVVCNGTHHRIEFASLPAATGYGDELAALMNAARADASKLPFPSIDSLADEIEKAMLRRSELRRRSETFFRDTSEKERRYPRTGNMEPNA